MRPNREHTSPASAAGSALRGLLLLLVGALAGANAVYFLMVRDADRCPDVETPAPGMPGNPSGGPEPEAGSAAGAVAARADMPSGEATHAGSPLRVDIRPIRRTPAGGGTSGAAGTAVAGTPGAGTAASATPVLVGGLAIPVAGVTAADLVDTFDDKRGSDRVHEALDIMAPAGTPVFAVADGHVEKLFDSDNGGLTIYQFEPTGRYAYYYAHLQRYAAGLSEGDRIRRGQVIGYVGSTGNASPEAPHLHFGIFRLGAEKRWWEGTAVNPYPLFVRD
jgi:murein DD-endopeptidase MepM/ murein hydrolase activator NlpD